MIYQFTDFLTIRNILYDANFNISPSPKELGETEVKSNGWTNFDLLPIFYFTFHHIITALYS